MDSLTLDRLIGEALPFVVGRRVEKVRAGNRVVVLELARQKERLLLSAWPRCAAAWRVSREAARSGTASPPGGRDGHALLLLRKHLEGARVVGLERVAGERWLRIETTGGTLALRPSGAAPSISLARPGEPVATLFGEDAWPLPEPRPGAGEWWQAPPPAGASAGERLRACPGLGPWLARAWDGDAGSWQRWQRAAATAAPHVVSLAPLARRDAGAAAADPPELWPIEPLDDRCAEAAASWSEAAQRVFEERRRGESFAAARQDALKAAREKRRRLSQLLAHLERDRDRLEPEERLRHAAEALLADPGAVTPGAAEATLADPRGGPPLHLKLDPRLRAVDNANRLFARARRNAGARERIAVRIAQARADLAAAVDRERALGEARSGAELPATPVREPAREDAAPRRYLTSGGLLLHVGRGAKENHQLTFGLARPEDLWFHARDVPGAHVILRDPEGRAAAPDLREAAEVAAYHSAAREAAAVDVHVARRKHLRALRGAAGRVQVGHSETLRVAPRDPEGRLRRR
ncbi:MAG: NFACT family protein [Vicinamibacteria bacterium]|nr:NFACT family protein [Vicinamibacteria bacterium]